MEELAEHIRTADGFVTKRIGQFLDELEWYEEALQRQRKEKGNPF